MSQFAFQQPVSADQVLVSCLVWPSIPRYLTPGLRNGRIVAGTGTIDRDGNVGDIGGIDKKVVASAREGAAIFFAPDNPVSEEEQKAHPDAKTTTKQP